ncbi:MAG: hypothetical protein E2581_06190 [Pseudomonas sp.]|uniref:hypothetical protein n=1 Tax=Pseudomonadota TaxID=1224 RepID=UPI001DF2C257|nr:MULTISPECIES: hypothetical protein [Pseudomonadota]MPS98075.1 hypothetical protein [Pseudomonas sp.]
MAISENIQDLRKWDDSRKGFKGEHWLVLGAGLLALRHARRTESGLGRLASGALGTVLIARAATGRDGVLATAERLAAKPTLAERLQIAARRL